MSTLIICSHCSLSPSGWASFKPCFRANTALRARGRVGGIGADSDIPAGKAVAPLLGGLGKWSFKVTTKSVRAQQFFDQGIRMVYAFNHAEAVRAFQEAAQLNPTLAMAPWGEALALGPNINAPLTGRGSSAQAFWRRFRKRSSCAGQRAPRKSRR